MKTLISSLILLVMTVAAAMLVTRDPGQVMVVFQDLSIQTSLGFFSLLVVVTFVVVYFLVRSLVLTLNLPANWRRWKRMRRLRQSEYFLTHGYLALTEGNWAQAEKFLRKGAGFSRIPALNFLGAARAAQQQGALERRDVYLKLAHEAGGGAAYAVDLTRAGLQLEQHQTEEAYATLQNLEAGARGRDQVKLMLLEASSELKDWERSLGLLRELEKNGAITADQSRARQVKAWAHILDSAAATGRLAELDRAWQSIPSALRRESYLLEVYVGHRLNHGSGGADTEELLRGVLRQHSDAALWRLYGLVEADKPVRQLQFIEKRMRELPQEGMLLLSAGRLYKRESLWGKARSCLEESLRVQPSAEAWHELATLFEQQGDSANAARCYREGLALAAGAPATAASGQTADAG